MGSTAETIKKFERQNAALIIPIGSPFKSQSYNTIMGNNDH